MTLDALTFYILSVIFLATLARSALGFGESLIAVPLLALYLPLQTAVPVSVLMSITVAAIVVIQDWKQIHIKSAGGLVFFTFLGIPIGLWLLTTANESLVKTGLGFLIILFSFYSLWGKKSLVLKSDSLVWLSGCGLLAGILGGAYGLNGPPLVAYGAMRRWSAQHFRATLQGYFLPASLLGMAGYWYKGLWTPEVTHYYLISLPAMLPAVFIGRYLNRKMEGQRFFNYLFSGLAAIGLLLLVQAVK